MKALILFVVALAIIGGGLKMAGVPLPLLDYRIGPAGEGQGPGMPDVVIEAPGFEDAQTLP